MKIIEQSYEIDHLEPEEDARRIAKGARICYKYPEAKNYKEACDIIYRVRKRGHLSVFEHSSMSVLFIINRGVSHELVRHRHTGYSQESSRYCNYSKDRFNNEIVFIKDFHTFETAVHDIWIEDLEKAEKTYFARLNAGQTPEEARGSLPNDTKTELYVTTNFREWRSIFGLRCDSHAHYQMREVMRPLLDDVKELCPYAFDDISY